MCKGLGTELSGQPCDDPLTLLQEERKIEVLGGHSEGFNVGHFVQGDTADDAGGLWGSAVDCGPKIFDGVGQRATPSAKRG